MTDPTTLENRSKEPAAAASMDRKQQSCLRDRVREIIRTEVDRHHPLNEARRSLELIVETSLHYTQTDGEPVIKVVNEHGEPRTISRAGQIVDMTISDVVEELRLQHPNLFRSPGEPSVPENGGSQASAGHERDWLNLAASRPSSPAKSDGPLQDSSPISDEGPMRAPARSSIREKLGRTERGFTAKLRSLRAGIPDRLDRARSALRTLPARVPRVRWPLAAGAAAVMLLAGGAVSLWERDSPVTEEENVIAEPTAAIVDPGSTGSISTTTEPPKVPSEPSPQEPADRVDAGLLRGAADVVDTSTLRIQGKIVRLFGVEWARGGGKPEDLGAYLRGREVACEPAQSRETYRCQVDGQDLSKVVLFNGGGRATSEATADLKAAEEKARSARVGVWSR